MAFLSNTAFEARVTNNEFDALCNITGKYQMSMADEDCSAGLLCKRGALLPCEGFGSTVFNENAYYMEVAGAGVKANEPIYACNMYEAKMIDNYFIGTETLGLGIPAGRYGTFTKIAFDGVSKYRFGFGNVTGGSVSSGDQYCTIDGGFLSISVSAPTTAGTPYFKIMGTGNFIEGTTDSFGYVDVEAHTA